MNRQKAEEKGIGRSHRQKQVGPFLHVSNHEYFGDNFISKPNLNPNPRYKVSILSHQY